MNGSMIWFLSLIAFVSIDSFDCKRPKAPVIISDPEIQCSQPKDPGTCKGKYKSWYFDPDLGECLQFTYSGCGGNDNNFRSNFECERVCDIPIPVVFGRKKKVIEPNQRFNSPDSSAKSSKPVKVKNFRVYDPTAVSRALNSASQEDHEEVDEDPCQQPPDSGPCNLVKRAWFYNFHLGYCLPFTYGGCHGNDNNFASRRSCERECAQSGNYGGGIVSRPFNSISV